MTTTKTTAAGTRVLRFPVLSGVVPDWWDYTRHNGTHYTWGGVPSVYSIDRRIGRDSSITYQTGRQGFNPCYHVQKRWVPQSSPEASKQVDNYPRSQTPGPTTVVHGVSPYSTLHYHLKYYGDFLTEVGNQSTSVSIDWNALSSNALAQMLPSIRSSLSLPNFLIELRDMRFLWKVLTGKYANMFFLIRTALGAAYSQRIGKKPMSRLASGYLAHQFAWRPFATDVIALVTGMLQLQRTIKEVIDRANQPQQRYWAAWVPGTNKSEQIVRVHTDISSAGGGVTGGFTPKGDTRVILHATEGVRYSATMRYSYPVPEALSTVYGQLKAGLDVLGISGNPAIIWNAIPFSFVVDWFVGVGKYLDRYDQKNVVFQTKITDFCHSARYQRRVSYEVRGRHRATNGSYFGTFTEADYCEIRTYDRRVGIPNLYGAISTSGLNPREFLLGGALVAANRR